MENDTINLKEYGEIHGTVMRKEREKENDIIILQSQKNKRKIKKLFTEFESKDLRMITLIFGCIGSNAQCY